jgi:hypothetical protein
MRFQMILATFPAIKMPNLSTWRFFQQTANHAIEVTLRDTSFEHFGRFYRQAIHQLFIGNVSCCGSSGSLLFSGHLASSIGNVSCRGLLASG